MADIRIKDLTTTASSTASDDFIAVDGATNGTRKLNAYSPSFGGNATVSGNLNIGGELQISSAYPAFKLTDTNSNSDFTILNDNGRLAVYDETNAAYRLTIGATGGVKIGTTPEDVGANNLTVQGTLAVNGAGTSSFQSTTPSTVEIANTTSGLSASQFAANGVVLGTLKFGHPSDGEAAKFPSIVGQFNATDASFARKTWLNFYTSDASGNNLVASLTDNKNLLIGGTTDISGTSGLKVFGTTASTSTSTGALVVSGGVGVAGALYVGSKGQFQSNDDALSLKYSTDGGACLLAWKNTSGTTLWSIGGGIDTRQDELVFRRGSTTVLNLNNSNNATFAGTLTVSAGSLVVDHVGSSSPTLSLSANGSVQSRFFANGSNTFLESYTNTPLILRTNQTTALTITSGQQVQVNASTASTSTSTGALVVSGGVGVAGEVYAGGTIRVVGSSHTLRFRRDDAIIDFSNTAENAYVTGTIIGNTLQLKGNNGTGLTIGTTGNATFAGNITTAAPAGGTAAAWKLGTVATVSPTSPNRTIEVDIGGTIYYIHAKTTNN